MRFSYRADVRFFKYVVMAAFFAVAAIVIAAPGRASAAAGSVASKIDFGVSIFSPHIKTEEMDYTTAVKMLESENKSLPMHAYILSSFVNRATTGTRAISESSVEIERMMAFLLLKFDPQRISGYFDRAYFFMLVANLGYPNFNGRSYALMALCDMATLIQAEPLNPYFHLFYTVIYASLKEHDIAEFKLYDPLEELKKALSFEVADPQFHYIVGSTFQAVSQNSPDVHQLAYAEFMQAIKLAPKNNLLKEKVFRNLIELLADYDQRRAPKPFWLEESAYLYLIEKNQDSAAAHNNLGYLYVMNNAKLDSALEHCKKAVSLEPDNPVFLDSLGCAYYKNRELKKAVETLEKAYKINPNSKDINEHLAEIYLQRNDNEAAVKFMEFMAKSDPQNALGLNNYGYVLCEAGVKLDEALKSCKAAVELEPANAIYLDSLAWAYFKNGKGKLALETLEKAEKIDPSIGALYIHRGDMLFCEDRIDDALASYVKGIPLDPNFPDVMLNYARLNSIKTLREKLKKAGKAVPKVKDVLNGAPFTYDIYEDYFDKLFESLGFPAEKKTKKQSGSKMGDKMPGEKIKTENDTAAISVGGKLPLDEFMASSEIKLFNGSETLETAENFIKSTSEAEIPKTTSEVKLDGAAKTSETLVNKTIEIQLNEKK